MLKGRLSVNLSTVYISIWISQDCVRLVICLSFSESNYVPCILNTGKNKLLFLIRETTPTFSFKRRVSQAKYLRQLLLLLVCINCMSTNRLKKLLGFISKKSMLTAFPPVSQVVKKNNTNKINMVIKSKIKYYKLNCCYILNSIVQYQH